MSEPDHFEQEQFDAFDDEGAQGRSLSSDSVSQALGYDMADRRIAILRGIAQSGSISQAARDVGVSYKAAWQAIDTLTNLAGAPLVERSVGGAGGGGAQMTPAGEELLHAAEAMMRLRTELMQRMQSGTPGGTQPNLGLMTSMRNQWPCTVLKVESMGGQIRVWLRAAMEAGSDWTIAARITPESYELQKILRQLADAGCDACVMEVSSQGIMMDRVAGIHYKVGVFTNLYPDHIGPGEHSSFEEYRSWKGKLFQRCDVGVVNADDPNTEALLEGHTCKLVTYGIHAPKVDYRASEQYRLLRNKEMLGVEFTLTEPDGHTLDVQVGMPGLFSIYNALATIGVGKVLGLADAPIHEGLKKALVKGRVELVPISHKFTILIDYAHNEAATESLIETLREYNPNRLVVVFGCGGNRSKLRRYGMGEVCAKLADFSILTEDNNRFEKVEDIIADIKTGMAKGNPDAKYVEIPDRLDALHYAIDHAQEGDLIAVIGKGHEAYRDREGVKTPFLERELIEEYAAETGVE